MVFTMKKHLIGAFAIILVLLSLCACSNTTNEITTQASTKAVTEKETIIKQGKANMEIEINGKSFTAEFYDSETAKAFQNMLPLTLDMNDLHGNEKYCYLDSSLPTKAQNVRTINEGDIMLFGNDCLVVFYESFSTSYSYTKIGYITDTAGLKEAVGNDDVTVTFNLK